MSYRAAKYVAAIGGVIIFAAPVLADSTGLAGILHALRKERGKICMADHFHFGQSVSFKKKSKAQADAVLRWRQFVTLEYGSDWGSFRRAASKSLNCGRAGGSWTCKVAARPCRKR